MPPQSDNPITSQIPLLRFTASLSKTSNALSHPNKPGYSTLDVLLMSYRSGLLRWRFTANPQQHYQIFSMDWQGVTQRCPWAERKLLISDGKLVGPKKRAINWSGKAGKAGSPQIDLAWWVLTKVRTAWLLKYPLVFWRGFQVNILWFKMIFFL